MKRFPYSIFVLWSAGLLLLAGSPRAFAEAAPKLLKDAILPEAQTLTRYSAIVANSPFALATPPPPPKQEDNNWAINFFISAIAKINDKDSVYVSSRDGSRFTLVKGEAASNGITLQEVRYSDQIARTTAKISKDGQTAVIEFDKMQILQTPRVNTVTAPAPMGQVNGRNVNAPRLPSLNPNGAQTAAPLPLPQALNPTATAPDGNENENVQVEGRRRIRRIGR